MVVACFTFLAPALLFTDVDSQVHLVLTGIRERQEGGWGYRKGRPGGLRCLLQLNMALRR